jgi:hypothetical protein
MIYYSFESMSGDKNRRRRRRIVHFSLISLKTQRGDHMLIRDSETPLTGPSLVLSRTVFLTAARLRSERKNKRKIFFISLYNSPDFVV